MRHFQISSDTRWGVESLAPKRFDERNHENRFLSERELLEPVGLEIESWVHRPRRIEHLGDDATRTRLVAAGHARSHAFRRSRCTLAVLERVAR